MASLPPIRNERINFDYIRRLVGNGARVILEIGAHQGDHTAIFLKLFPSAMIYAFEPDPRAAKKFKASITNPRVRLFEMAIGAEDGEATFHVSSGLPANTPPAIRAQYPDGWDRSGSLHLPKTHKTKWPWCKFDKSITITVRSLDSWASQYGIGTVDFIWADMQGAEGDLVRNGQATLARTRYLFTEYSNEELYEGEPTLEKLLNMLPNFVVMKRYPDDVLLKNKSLERSGILK